MAKKTGFLVGAILGALTGAAAALAAAPKEGKKLRQDIKDFYEDYKEDPKAKLDEVKDSALSFYDEKSGQVVEFSTEKFNDIKEKFDNGDITADKAKAFLLAKKDEIKAKVEAGDLSKEKVLDFLNATKAKISETVSDFKAADDAPEAAQDHSDEDFSLELEQEDLVKKAAVISAKADELVAQVETTATEEAAK
ncbi:MAG: YtxH domain-containing protein [Streptococcaceae bacterium]|jgi:gas vesicle protein|nr:YtxH domain-containing protein [Streptococcaceae bacterium]